MNKSEFCKKLAFIRGCKEAGYTASSIASRLDVSEKVVTNLENGSSNFSLNFLFRYMKQFTGVLEIYKRNINVVFNFDSDSDVANFIKDYRNHSYLSQQEFADQLGCSVSILRNIELGRTSMKIDLFFKMANMLGFEVDCDACLVYKYK